MPTKIYESYAQFLQRENKEDNGVSPYFADRYPNWQEDNDTNTGCWNCIRSTHCSYCVSLGADDYYVSCHRTVGVDPVILSNIVWEIHGIVDDVPFIGTESVIKPLSILDVLEDD